MTTLDHYFCHRELPLTAEVAGSQVRLQARCIVDEKTPKEAWILEAIDLNPIPWKQRGVFLTDTFYLTRREAELAFATGFIPGDQESGEISEELHDVITAMENQNLLEVVWD
jgi:hypothetical protein